MARSTRNHERFNGIRRLAAGAALGVLLVSSAQAQGTQTETVWKCWYNQDTRLQCVLRSAANDASPDPRYLNNAKLPQTVKQLWTEPASMADKRVYIPLFTEPDDWNRVSLLAASVLCGANRACIVDVSRNFVEAALLDPGIDE